MSILEITCRLGVVDDGLGELPDSFTFVGADLDDARASVGEFDRLQDGRLVEQGSI